MNEISGTVKFHSYRTALVGDIFLEFPRDMMDKLEEALAAKAGVRRDNHTVYEVGHDNGYGESMTYFWFSDLKVLVGRTIESKRH